MNANLVASLVLLMIAVTTGQGIRGNRPTTSTTTPKKHVQQVKQHNLPNGLKGGFVTSTETSRPWDYLDQSKWSSIGSCGGYRQSPIDLQDICFEGTATKVNESLSLTLVNYDIILPPRFLTLANNGHTAVLTLANSTTFNKAYPMVTGTVADKRFYQFTQLHFHWDQNDARGSEHSIHGAREALEMHLVHWNVRYGSFEKAEKHPDGLLVIAVLYGVDVTENDLLAPIVDRLDDITRYGTKVHLGEPITMKSLLPPTYKTFYTYKGSLTTPPCSEIVTWAIVSQVQRIGYGQLYEFSKLDNRENRGLGKNRKIGNTNRSLQPLNGRVLQASSNKHCRTHASMQKPFYQSLLSPFSSRLG